MTRLVLFSFTTILFVACGQNNTKAKIYSGDRHPNKDSIEYIQKCIDFIKQIQRKDFQDSTYVLADMPFSFNYFHCLREVLTDTNTYSKNEFTFIEQKKYPSVSYWTKELFPTIKLVSSDTVGAIFKDPLKGWKYFYKNIGHSFNSFSVPIFLRNYTYCLFYSANSCGTLCGAGRLTLYKKKGNKWEEVKSYCDWVS